jgi:glyoxylase-like metal-dependent hydrolase (beta-lactamase superfamily II)/rhodanese-related sulfurtransferase
MTTEEILIDKEMLATWLSEKKPITILDIRPFKEREEWLIPGSMHSNVYDKLKANDPTAFDEIDVPNNQPIVTVCGGGKLSITAAEVLRDMGYRAFSLQGGMKSWNFAWNTATIEFPGVKIIQVRRSSKGCLSYIIGSDSDAMVIDASLDPQVYMDIAKKNGWTIRYVTDTHIHADFLSRTRELAQATQAKHLLLDMTQVEYRFTPIKNGDQIKIGSVVLEVMHTPGHTIESTSFRLGDEAIFTGDMLFVDGVGRPDLKANREEAYEKSRMLYQSVHQIVKLNSNTLVLPAHISQPVAFDNQRIGATIKNLKSKLELLKLGETDFIQFTMSHIPPAPPNYLTIAALNKQASWEKHLPAELEAGANRCAIS